MLAAALRVEKEHEMQIGGKIEEAIDLDADDMEEPRGRLGWVNFCGARVPVGPAEERETLGEEVQDKEGSGVPV